MWKMRRNIEDDEVMNIFVYKNKKKKIIRIKFGFRLIQLYKKEIFKELINFKKLVLDLVLKYF